MSMFKKIEQDAFNIYDQCNRNKLSTPCKFQGINHKRTITFNQQTKFSLPQTDSKTLKCNLYKHNQPHTLTTTDQQTLIKKNKKITSGKIKPNSRSKTTVSYTDNCLVSKYRTEVLSYLLTVYTVYTILYLSINILSFFGINKLN